MNSFFNTQKSEGFEQREGVAFVSALIASFRQIMKQFRFIHYIYI